MRGPFPQDTRACCAVCLLPLESEPPACTPRTPCPGAVLSGLWGCGVSLAYAVVPRNSRWAVAWPNALPVSASGSERGPDQRPACPEGVLLSPGCRSASMACSSTESAQAGTCQPSSKHSLFQESNLHLLPTTDHLLIILWNRVQILPKWFCF